MAVDRSDLSAGATCQQERLVSSGSSRVARMILTKVARACVVTQIRKRVCGTGRDVVKAVFKAPDFVS
jgi:hypothetical protein